MTAPDLQRYGILYPVNDRMRKRFTQEEITTAAKVYFFHHLPGCFDLPDGTSLAADWSADYLTDAECVRVYGDVEEVPGGAERPAASALPGDDHGEAEQALLLRADAEVAAGEWYGQNYGGEVARYGQDDMERAFADGWLAYSGGAGFTGSG